MVIKRIGNLGEYYGNDYNSSNQLNTEQMKVNARYIRSYFSDWSLNALSGMLGNMQAESSINPRSLAK